MIFDLDTCMVFKFQLKSLYAEATEVGNNTEQFVADCEEALNKCLVSDELPSDDLIDSIATCKIQAVERSIDLCFRLKQEVGSFALMDDAGFKHMDFLQCCKFAEGAVTLHFILLALFCTLIKLLLLLQVILEY